MKLYSLEINGQTICEVTAEAPAWLPVKPTLNKRWLRGLVAQAIRNYFARQYNHCQSEVVKA